MPLSTKKIEPIRLKESAGNTGEIAVLRERTLNSFLEKLQEREGENLLKVVLFGSVARGDSRPDSDMDLFILVREGQMWDLSKRIVDISVDADMDEGECKVHISPFINILEEYQEDKDFGIPVFHHIDEEGLVLYDAERQ